jgi:hypothetical protein
MKKGCISLFSYHLVLRDNGYRAIVRKDAVTPASYQYTDGSFAELLKDLAGRMRLA